MNQNMSYMNQRNRNPTQEAFQMATTFQDLFGSIAQDHNEYKQTHITSSFGFPGTTPSVVDGQKTMNQILSEFIQKYPNNNNANNNNVIYTDYYMKWIEYVSSFVSRSEFEKFITKL